MSSPSSVTFYDISIGPYIKAMNILLGILDEAAPSAEASSLLNARLAPDMYPLASQVRIATRAPVALVEALTSTKLVSWWDDVLETEDEQQQPAPATKVPVWGEKEKSWPELKARVEKTLAMLQSVDAATANSKAGDAQLPLQVAHESLGARAFRNIPAADFTLANGLPNTLFHVYMTYAILRSRGVNVQKRHVLFPFLPGYVLEDILRDQSS